jgi:hypothetical protein
MFVSSDEYGSTTRKRVYTDLLTAWSKFKRYATRQMGMTGVQQGGRTWRTSKGVACRLIAILLALGLIWGALKGLGGRSGDLVAHRKLGQHMPTTSLEADSEQLQAGTEEVRKVVASLSPMLLS